MEKRKLIHLYNRFGFGLNGKELKALSKRRFKRKLAKEKPELLQLNLSELEDLDWMNASDKQKMEARKSFRNKLIDLNLLWLQKMTKSKNIVEEKMNLFWHHHFACIIKNPLYGLQFTNTIRKHATLNFGDMLLGVAQSAAMIDFLHTKQNRKKQPNEDFARELCEIYTLGRDKEYTENDVREIARTFTGWNHTPKGEFFIRPRQHDNGKKTIFGKTGNFNGDEVIKLILEKKQCAKFICENLYEYFINPSINEQHIVELTEVLYNNNYEIKPLLLHIANSDWFYEDANIMAKIKSPIELIVGLARQFNVQTNKPKSWIFLQKILDQTLYTPPNVKGWKVDKEWIDSNSLPLRLRLPSTILTNGLLDIAAKPDYDTNPNDGQGKNKFAKKLGFTADWDYFFTQNKDVDFIELFFNSQLSNQAQSFLKNRKFDSKQEEIIQLISLPEYQLV